MKVLRYITLAALAALLGLGGSIGALSEGTLAQAQECTVTLQPGNSIQAAIDQAAEGAVICLAEGEWEENLTITKSLALRGEGPAQSVIRAKEGNRPVIRIGSPEGEEVVVSIENLKVTGARGGPDGVSILVEDSAQAAITKSTISENGRDGIVLLGSAQATISGSAVSGNGGYGIVLFHSAQATLTGSTISENERYGIELLGSAQATIEGNEIFGNGSYGVALYEQPCFDTDSVVFSGYVTGKRNAIPGPGEPNGNKEGAVCPAELSFLRTEEGGELDRR